MICVFLDTNILHSKSNDYTKARFIAKIDELTEEIEVNDLYPYVKLVIPQIVISELRKQQIDDCADKVSELRKTRVTQQIIEVPENYEKTCDDIFDTALNSLQKGTVKTEVAPYPPNDVLPGIIQRAICKNPPFEGKDKQSDKGFKDTLIWETLLDYKRKNKKAIIVLYSKDIRITDAFLIKEYKQIFNEDIYMIKREDPNTHRLLMQKLRELANVEEERETFSQELKDRLINLMLNIPTEYLFVPSEAFEINNETLIIDYCSVDNVTINEELEEDDTITFYLTLNVLYNYKDIKGDFGVIETDASAIVNYSLTEDKFYLKGNEDPSGSFVEHTDIGVELY